MRQSLPLVASLLALAALSTLACDAGGPTAPSPAAEKLATADGPIPGVAPGAASATVNRGFLCFVGIIDGFPLVATTDSHSTTSSSGKENLTCHGQLPAGTEPSSAVVQRGFVCATFSGPSSDSQQVISPSGQITLRCRAG